MGRSALGSYTTFIHSTFIHSRFIQLHSVYRVINEKKFCDPLVPRYNSMVCHECLEHGFYCFTDAVAANNRHCISVLETS